MKIIKVLIISTFIFCSCVTSPVEVKKPWGETATVKMTDGRELNSELLSVDDSALIFVSNGVLNEVSLSKIDNINVEGYSLKRKKTSCMIPMLIGYGIAGGLSVYMLTAEHYTAWPLVLSLTSIAMIPITYFAFRSGDPQVKFSPPFKESALKQLKAYCRYPQGLTEEQLAELRLHYKP